MTLHKWAHDHQPDSPDLIRLECCRCGCALIVNRGQVDKLDADSRPALCSKCEGEQ